MGLFDIFKRKKKDNTPKPVQTHKRYWLNSNITLCLPVEWQVEITEKFKAYIKDKDLVLGVKTYEKEIIFSSFEIDEKFFEGLKFEFYTNRQKEGFFSADEIIVTNQFISKSFVGPQMVEYYLTAAKKFGNVIHIVDFSLEGKGVYSPEVRQELIEISKTLSYVWDFSSDFMLKMKQKSPFVEEVSLDKLEVKWKYSSSNEVHLTLLDNAYSEYVQNPHSLEEILNKYADSTLSSFQPPKQDVGNVSVFDAKIVTSDQILPLIKDGIFVRSLREKVDISDEIVYEPLNSELFIVYAIDDGSTLRYLLMSDMEKIGLQRNELRALSIKNLMTQVEVLVEDETSHYRVVSDGNFDASFLLIPEVWTKENFPNITGNIWVAVPSRDMLLVADSSNPFGVAFLKQKIQEVVNRSEHPISDKIFEFRNGLFMILN